MRSILIIIPLVLLYGCCTKHTPAPNNIMAGKIKSIIFFDSTQTDSFILHYDTISGKLLKVTKNNLDKFSFSKSEPYTIKMQAYLINTGNSTLVLHLNNNYKMQSINELDTVTNLETNKYYIKYDNQENLDTFYEPSKEFFITNFYNIKNYFFSYENGNYTQMKKSFFFQNLAGNSYNDTLEYVFTFSQIENKGFIPMQEFSAYTPFYAPVSTINLYSLFDNTLFYKNKNLISTAQIINGNDTTTYNYDYVIDMNCVRYMYVNSKKTFEFNYF